jgi:hypothetical protein
MFVIGFSILKTGLRLSNHKKKTVHVYREYRLYKTIMFKYRHREENQLGEENENSYINNYESPMAESLFVKETLGTKISQEYEFGLRAMNTEDPTLKEKSTCTEMPRVKGTTVLLTRWALSKKHSSERIDFKAIFLVGGC